MRAISCNSNDTVSDVINMAEELPIAIERGGAPVAVVMPYDSYISMRGIVDLHKEQTQKKREEWESQQASDDGSVVFTGSTERLTWEQIEERYPHKWVGLKDVEFNDGGPDVVSAVVAVTGTRSGVFDCQINGDIEIALLTYPDSIPSNWMLWPVADNGSAV